MKYITFLFSVLISWGSASAASDREKTILVPLTFPKAEFSREGAVKMEGLPNTVDAGFPSVPVKTLKIALPAGTTLDRLTIEEGRHSRHGGGIAIATGMMPMSWFESPPNNLRSVAAPRIEGAQYPESHAKVSLQHFHGVPIALVSVYPITVAQDLRSADVLESAVIRLSLKAENTRASLVLLPHQEREIAAFVDNAEGVATYPVRKDRLSAGYEYLILSTADFIGYTGENSLKELQKGLEGRGLHSKVVDVSSLKQRSGRDLPEKIRDYIRGEYKNSGIQYVLLAGKAKINGSGVVIPARNLWSKINAYLGGSWTVVEEQIPADMYYACLDGSYNGNQNDKWGEPNDGDDGGDVDFLCEVSIGRAAMESTTDLQNFVRKTLWAYANPMAKSTLMLGEDLFPEMNLSGSDYLSQLEGQVTEHGFSTSGYGNDWTIDKLDDRVKKWAGSEALSQISSEKYSMVHHLGHSNTTYNMRLSVSAQFLNQDPFFYYTQGCLAGRFISGSFVDKMVRQKSAAVAAIANTTYGLAPEDPAPTMTKTPGASHMLHRQFVNAIFVKAGTSVGMANKLSKQALLDFKSAQEIRWVHWSTTLFGDPSLQMSF